MLCIRLYRSAKDVIRFWRLLFRFIQYIYKSLLEPHVCTYFWRVGHFWCFSIRLVCVYCLTLCAFLPREAFITSVLEHYCNCVSFFAQREFDTSLVFVQKTCLTVSSFVYLRSTGFWCKICQKKKKENMKVCLLCVFTRAMLLININTAIFYKKLSASGHITKQKQKNKVNV